MVAIAKKSRPRTSVPAWHNLFLAMLPAIICHARISFKHLDRERRDEAVQEVVCNACCAVARLAELDKLDLCYPSVLARFAVARLAELGKLDLAYPSVLARYGVAQVKAGRKVGCTLNCRDVLSPYCQRLKHVNVERLDHFDREENAWEELVVEDRRAGPAEVVATKLDFGGWLRSLPIRSRRIARTLAVGETTSATAQRFKVTEGRISQLRRELADSWWHFVGDPAVSGAATTAVA